MNKPTKMFEWPFFHKKKLTRIAFLKLTQSLQIFIIQFYVFFMSFQGLDAGALGVLMVVKAICRLTCTRMSTITSTRHIIVVVGAREHYKT